MTDRLQIKRLILNGKIDDAEEMLNTVQPDVLFILFITKNFTKKKKKIKIKMK